MSYSTRIATTATAAALATAMALTAISTSQAVGFKASPVSADPVVKTVGSKLTGKQRLNRLFRPHYRIGNPITKSVRIATGDPNIQVLDYRGTSTSRLYTCSYFNLRKGQRVLKCE
ncbi:MAG: hypothetical protein HRU27_20370 [Rhizobiaceae bacterium]|nr:hypothetical protein [Hyphomicrobiales bacterium]NRB32943.1 hypothetical protein [Rhizobiaceae bacterium]